MDRTDAFAEYAYVLWTPGGEIDRLPDEDKRFDTKESAIAAVVVRIFELYGDVEIVCGDDMPMRDFYVDGVLVAMAG